MNRLTEQHNKILSAKESLLIEIRDHLLYNKVDDDHIYVGIDHIMINTDENYSYHSTINTIRDLNLSTLNIDDCSDKATFINLN